MMINDDIYRLSLKLRGLAAIYEPGPERSGARYFDQDAMLGVSFTLLGFATELEAASSSVEDEVIRLRKYSSMLENDPELKELLDACIQEGKLGKAKDALRKALETAEKKGQKNHLAMA